MTDVSEKAPRVAVILVNWNGWQDCIECLDALLVCDYAAFDIFLVDNASQDRSLEHIVEWCAAPRKRPGWKAIDGVHRITERGESAIPYTAHDAPPAAAIGSNSGPRRLHLIRSGANLGFAGGNNVGMRAAGIDNYAFFWLLNTDTVVDFRALSQLVDRASRNVLLGMVGSTLRYYSDPHLLQAMGGARMDPETTSFACIGIGESVSAVPSDPSAVEQQMAYVVGASMLVSTDFVRTIGYMQEDYFLYFEEPDWAWRSRHRFRLAYAPTSVVYHKVGASSAQVASLYSLNLICRNRIRFVARFMPDRMFQTKRHMYRQMLGRAIRLRFREALVMARALRDASSLSASVVSVDQS